MHPTLRILALLSLAILVQLLQLAGLLAVGTLVLGAALLWHAGLLRKMLRRSRWLLLTLLLIFAFSTPGEYLPWWTLRIAPTYEGLQSGLLQAARLVIMLAGLAVLLGSTPREQLMAGIFQLLLPLRHCGLGVERFTARLWLTLHYVEEDHPRMRGNLWQALDRLAMSDQDHYDAPVRFSLPALGRRDGLVLLAAALFAALWWLA